SRLEALKETPMPLTNPSLTINGKTITFATTLAADCYLEYNGAGSAKVFDPNGFPGGEVTIKESVPEVKAGENKIKFLCDTNARYGQTARITLISRGESIK
ncbi:MAG: hypothetical protein WCU00_07220, partial [Candidatus Latescibacterota bacterium]